MAVQKLEAMDDLQKKLKNLKKKIKVVNRERDTAQNQIQLFEENFKTIQEVIEKNERVEWEQLQTPKESQKTEEENLKKEEEEEQNSEKEDEEEKLEEEENFEKKEEEQKGEKENSEEESGEANTDKTIVEEDLDISDEEFTSVDEAEQKIQNFKAEIQKIKRDRDMAFIQIRIFEEDFGRIRKGEKRKWGVVGVTDDEDSEKNELKDNDSDNDSAFNTEDENSSGEEEDDYSDEEYASSKKARVWAPEDAWTCPKCNEVLAHKGRSYGHRKKHPECKISLYKPEDAWTCPWCKEVLVHRKRGTYHRKKNPKCKEEHEKEIVRRLNAAEWTCPTCKIVIPQRSRAKKNDHRRKNPVCEKEYQLERERIKKIQEAKKKVDKKKVKHERRENREKKIVKGSRVYIDCLKKPNDVYNGMVGYVVEIMGVKERISRVQIDDGPTIQVKKKFLELEIINGSRIRIDGLIEQYAELNGTEGSVLEILGGKYGLIRVKTDNGPIFRIKARFIELIDQPFFELDEGEMKIFEYGVEHAWPCPTCKEILSHCGCQLYHRRDNPACKKKFEHKRLIQKLFGNLKDMGYTKLSDFLTLGNHLENWCKEDEILVRNLHAIKIGESEGIESGEPPKKRLKLSNPDEEQILNQTPSILKNNSEMMIMDLTK